MCRDFVKLGGEAHIFYYADWIFPLAMAVSASVEGHNIENMKTLMAPNKKGEKLCFTEESDTWSILKTGKIVIENFVGETFIKSTEPRMLY